MSPRPTVLIESGEPLSSIRDVDPDVRQRLGGVEYPVRTRQGTRAEYDRLIEIGVFQPR
jgi:hypothetical protein